MNAKHALWRIWTASFMLLAALVSGCSPEDITPAPLCAYLPEPTVPSGVPRRERAPLSLEAALRNCEAEKFVAADYQAKGYRIVATTEKPSGQIMDWMAAETVPGSERPTPPPIADDYQPPPGVEIGKTELEMYPELRGPKGTVGMPRRTFPEYVSGESGARSLEEYLLQRSKKRRTPTGNERLYAGYGYRDFNIGAFSTVDAFAGPEIENGTLSLMEMIVTCKDPDPSSGKEEAIGIAASRDRRNFNYQHPDSQLYLQVEHYLLDPNNPKKELQQIGGWVGGDYTVDDPFKWVTNHKYHPNDPIPASTLGGLHYEHRFGIQLWQGEWWLGYQGEWFGSYPSTVFTQMRSYACQAMWYVEVYDETPDDWTYTDGGSGEFAKYLYPSAAYFKRMAYMDILGWYQWLQKNAALPVKPYNPNCYTATPMEVTGQPWAENGFYGGGPGNDPVKAPSCKSYQ